MWGRTPKDRTGIKNQYGARAIYTGQQIDIVWDRQAWWTEGCDEGNGFTTEQSIQLKPLQEWINQKALPYLRKLAPSLYGDENRVVEYNEGPFHIEASPQRSYGYLYIGAWEYATAPERVAPSTPLPYEQPISESRRKATRLKTRGYRKYID